MTSTNTEHRLSLPQGVEENDDQNDKLPETATFSMQVNESAKLALRVSFALTLGSIFCLAFGPDGYPDALWVYITAGVVSWQSNPDTGSVFKKAWQRTVGTTLGGLTGLGMGAISLAIPESGSSAQAAYIGISNTLISFGSVYFTCEMGFRGHYAAILGTITFGLALLAFYSDQPEDAWRVACFRIVNIVVGGILGSIASLVVFPVSTRRLVESKVSKAMKQAGETAMEVFSAMGNDDGLPSFNSILQDETTEDPGHAAYKKGLAEVQSTRALLNLVEYDPFFKTMSKRDRQDTIDLWRMKLGRVVRLQANIITLDNVVRGKLTGDDDLRFGLLDKIGSHCAILLDDSQPKDDRHRAALAMLNDDLPAVRDEISQRRKEEVTSVSASKEHIFAPEKLMRRLSDFDDENANVQISELFSTKQTCLFYQMVEGLILRCIRLYHVSTKSVKSIHRAPNLRRGYPRRRNEEHNRSQ